MRHVYKILQQNLYGNSLRKQDFLLWIEMLREPVLICLKVMTETGECKHLKTTVTCLKQCSACRRTLPWDKHRMEWQDGADSGLVGAT